MSEKLTDWFPADVEPVRVGEYEVRNSRPIHHNSKGLLRGTPFRYWDGNQWMTCNPESPEFCIRSIMGTHETHQWRGLAEEPK